MFAYAAGNDSINVHLPKFEEQAFLNAIEVKLKALKASTFTVFFCFSEISSQYVDNGSYNSSDDS